MISHQLHIQASFFFGYKITDNGSSFKPLAFPRAFVTGWKLNVLGFRQTPCFHTILGCDHNYRIDHFISFCPNLVLLSLIDQLANHTFLRF